MNPLLLLSSFLASALTQGTLRNYPHCGELGDEAKKECFWDCEWEALPFTSLTAIPSGLTTSISTIGNEAQPSAPYGEWKISQRPTSTRCLKDCPSIQYCLAKYIAKYDDVSVYDVTDQVIIPYFDCLRNTSVQFISQNNDRRLVGDSIHYLIFQSCLSHALEQSRFNCFEEFVKGKKKYRLKKKDRRRLSEMMQRYSVSANPPRGRLGGFPVGDLRTENTYDKSSPININNTLGQYPWLCSLKTRGYRGQHQCGVTLLSAPPATTVLVSAAHCNFVCRDSEDYIVETCCCRKEMVPSTCRTFNPYCGVGATLQPARPKDLQIVCREWDIGTSSLPLTIEDELVLTVTNYTNHPQFNITVGPAGGHDIAVYTVNDSQLAAPGVMQRRVLWPACLPSLKHRGMRGIVAGWRTPGDLAGYYPEFTQSRLDDYMSLFLTVAKYKHFNLILRHAGVENITCSDPAWMESNSPYPAGTVCARDPSLQSCFDTGDSGSGLMMEQYQGGYSWEGALSAYKGCDGHVLTKGKLLQSLKTENPAIFTQGSCYLPWIASTYGLSLGPGLAKGCRAASGDPEDVEKEECQASDGNRCMFETGLVYNVTGNSPVVNNDIGLSGIPWDQCLLGGHGVNNVDMVYWCVTELDSDNVSLATFASCANNCRGVRTSDIIAGGAVVLAAASVGALSAGPGLGLSLLGPGLGFSMLGMGLTGVAGVGMARMMCLGPVFCRTRGQCCMVIGDSQGGVRCPRSC